MILSIPPAVPGFIVTLVGAAIVASRSHTAAQAFDKAEGYARKLIAKVWRKKKATSRK